MAARDRQAGSAAVEFARAGMSRQMDVLGQMRDVTCATSGVFMQDLTELSRLVAAVPLQLPTTQGYVLELKNGALHVSGKKTGIETFELSDPSAHVTKVVNNAEGLLLEIRKSESRFTVVLHRDAHDEPEKARRARAAARQTEPERSSYSGCSSERSYVTRRSTPWREAAVHSESRGGCGGGER